MKLTGQSPDEVRSWDYEDLLGLLAYCELENEEFKKNTHQPPSSASARAHASGPTTNTTVYRFGPKPAPKR